MGGMLAGRASLRPRPGREGMTRWKACCLGEVPSSDAASGSVRGLMRCPRDRLVKGNGGTRRRGTASGCGERAWMKWTRRAALPRFRRVMVVRNWGRVLLSVLSASRQEYFSSLCRSYMLV